MSNESSGTGRGVTRRGVLAGAGGLAAAGVVPAAVAAAAGPRRIGEPSDGTAAAEVIGRLDQNADAITGYGYLTRINGLPVADLFRGSPHGESTARFTFASTVQVNARFLRGALVSVDGVGSVTFFLDAGGGDFANPPTFSDGTPIAKFGAHFHNLLTVIAPHQGVSTITGELRQHAAPTFTLGGRPTRFGRRGLRLTLSVAGPSTRTADTPPVAFFDVAGDLRLAP